MPEIRDPDAPASQKQVDFLITLANTRETGMPANQVVKYLHDLHRDGKLTRAMASQYIETWKSKPQREFLPGYYRLSTGQDVVVFIHLVENKKKTGTYTKVWNGFEHRWEYAPDHKKFIPEAERMTVEQMAKFGQVTGYCIVCGAALTDPASVTRGMGPVCFSRVQP